MRILLDECAPRPLKRELANDEVRTVVEMGMLDIVAPGEVIEVGGS